MAFRNDEVAAQERIEMLERQNRELAERLRAAEEARLDGPLSQARPSSLRFVGYAALAFLLTGALLLLGGTTAVAVYRAGPVRAAPQERDYAQAPHERMEGPRISPAAQRAAE
jgi:hypothetical protein